MPDPLARTSSYEFGHATLGPIFAAFALLLIREAERRKLRRLAFVARDGDLLREATRRLLQHFPLPVVPEMTYVHLSRRATALPALEAMNAAAIEAAAAVRAGPLTLGMLLAFHGLDACRLLNRIERHGLGLDTRISSPSRLSDLFADEAFQAEIATSIAKQKGLLSGYLAEHDLQAGSPTSLVDIGWRGSIQNNLSKTFHGKLTGLYFGLWSENNSTASFPATAVGIICDQRRGRGLREGAAWYAAHLLEAICRAPEGTTLSYREVDGRVMPMLATDASRGAEIESAETANDVRTGILDRIEELAKDRSWSCQPDDQVRRTAQDSLFRLAFFPSPAAIAIGKNLVHTEGHAGGWSAPLIASGPHRSLTSPRQWLAGLASPWRAGYVCATGGAVAARLFAWTESALGHFPPRTRRQLASLARRVAGLSNPQQ